MAAAATIEIDGDLDDDWLYGDSQGSDGETSEWSWDYSSQADGQDVLNGGGGSDHLFGQGNDDRLFGGAANNDFLYGDDNSSDPGLFNYGTPVSRSRQRLHRRR